MPLPHRYLPLILVAAALCAPSPGMVVLSSATDAQLAAAPHVVDLAIDSHEILPDPALFARFRARASVVGVQRTDPSAPLTAGNHVYLTGIGGERGELGISIPGLPRPRVGRRYRAHLRPVAGGDFEVAGFEDGLVPIDGQRGYSRNRTDGSNGEGSGAFLYWDPRAFPIPYYLSAPTFASVPELVPLIDNGFKVWRDIGSARVEFIAMGCTSVIHNENDGLNTVILVMESWPFSTDAIAVTRNFYVAGEEGRAGLILDSDILLNGVNHRFSATVEPDKHDVQNIVAHEVGHFLGLGHEVDPFDDQSTMFARANLGETKKRDLRPSDEQGILDAYGGAGTKIPLTTTFASCQVGRSGTSCAATHRPMDPAARRGWMLSLLLAALAWMVGRYFNFFSSPRAPAATGLFGNRSRSSW